LGFLEPLELFNDKVNFLFQSRESLNTWFFPAQKGTVAFEVIGLSIEVIEGCPGENGGSPLANFFGGTVINS
jgi:hypothetical protein